jgi:hypothetical protein
MDDDEIEELRARLSRLSGPARVPLLHELGQALAQRHWRTGVGTPAARPDLDAAIEAFQECCRWLRPDDGYRPLIAGQLGQLLANRYAIYLTAETDRETGLQLMTEALAAVRAPVHRDLLRLELGQLHLGRVVCDLRSAQRLVAAMRTSARDSYAAEADQATAYFQVVLDGPSSEEIAAAARALLELAAVVKELAGAVGGFDAGRLTRAVLGVQRTRKRLAEVPHAGDLQAADFVDRPVAHVRAREPERAPRPAPPRPEPVTLGVDDLRRALRERIVRGADLWTAISWRLRPDAASDARLVDDWVALATLVRHHGGETATDRLLLAAGLYLRGRLWDEQDWPDAAAHLRAIADRLPAEPPTVVALAAELAARLGDPAVNKALANAFAEVVTAMRTSGAGAWAIPWSGGLVRLSAATGTFDVGPAGPVPGRTLIAGRRLVPGLTGTISYVSSAAEIVALAGRKAPPITADAVFLADPCGEDACASIDALTIRQRFYPASTGLGRVVTEPAAPGGPKDVLSHLDASMLSLDCGVNPDGSLRLAGPARLTPAQIAAYAKPTGGLAIVPSAGPGFWALADALLAAGFTGVIGWLRPVPRTIASLALYVLHAHLAKDNADPAEAVRATREWLADPTRAVPPDLPAPYAVTLTYGDLSPAEALVQRGR